MTLRRFFRERAEGRFGFFADTSAGGRLTEIGATARPYTRTEAERGD